MGAQGECGEEGGAAGVGTEGKRDGEKEGGGGPYKNGGREGGGERSTILPSAFKKGVWCGIVRPTAMSFEGGGGRLKNVCLLKKMRRRKGAGAFEVARSAVREAISSRLG